MTCFSTLPGEGATEVSTVMVVWRAAPPPELPPPVNVARELPREKHSPNTCSKNFNPPKRRVTKDFSRQTKEKSSNGVKLQSTFYDLRSVNDNDNTVEEQLFSPSSVSVVGDCGEKGDPTSGTPVESNVSFTENEEQKM
jgi:hypothetical protein